VKAQCCIPQVQTVHTHQCAEKLLAVLYHLGIDSDAHTCASACVRGHVSDTGSELLSALQVPDMRGNGSRMQSMEKAFMSLRTDLLGRACGRMISLSQKDSPSRQQARDHVCTLMIFYVSTFVHHQLANVRCNFQTWQPSCVNLAEQSHDGTRHCKAKTRVNTND
jgi:hypothetical protein